MNTPLQSQQAEREAMSRLLASGLFARSPNLERILVYLCEKHFEGQSHLIKEYHVATEALGRSEDFDPKKDSIVRVEMHRLRKRLREYYESTPADAIHISIPEKSYLPEFRYPDGASARGAVAPASAGVPPASAPATAVPAPDGVSRRWWWIPVAAIGSAAGVTAWLSRSPGKSAPAINNTSAPAPVADAVPAASRGEIIRIMAGHAAGRITDRYGRAWQGDRYFKGGTAVAVSTEVTGRGFDPNVFAHMREGEFTYAIPLKPGFYELLLLFAETQYGERNPMGGGETSRVFSVSANGKTILREFDALGETSDPNTATARLIRDLSPAADGNLHLQFGPASAGKPFLNAMEIRPGVRGRIRPIRIVCRPETFRDAAGNTWEPDLFYKSGKQISRPQGAPFPDGDLLRGERYGNFSYIIPVPPGKYGARLYFWDYWWGEGHPGKGGIGSRVFDVFCNHKPLLTDMDIIRQNPKDQVVVHTFHSL
jgi:hypothetical protein